MRRPKISLKKYFYFILFCALILVFVFNLKEREIWKSKAQGPSSHAADGYLLYATIDKGLHHIPKMLETQQLAEALPPPAPMSADAEVQIKSKLNLNNNKELLEEPNNFNEINSEHDGGDFVNLDGSISTGSDNNNNNNNYINNINNFNNNLNINLNNNNNNKNNGGSSSSGIFEAISSTLRPWFFKNGEYYPKPFQPTLQYSNNNNNKKMSKKKANLKLRTRSARMFPHQEPYSDRIVNQLMFVPNNYEQIRASGKLKTILLFNGLGPWNVKQGRDVFLRSKCPVDTCEITANREKVSTADMILYKDHYVPPGIRRPMNSRQVTMLYYLECPYHTQNVKIADAINWTATYRRDSSIVTPYEKWQFYNPNIRSLEQDRNYAANKTKKVAWFVSNCGARNGRLQYAHELRKYIDVDIYGACGNFKCSRNTADKCFDILDHDYKFYLAFENSNCKHYITEKFYVNALTRNILPIVMGARPEDYEETAPPRSYIHVDEFSSPRELAEYLYILDKNDELYNSYFKWKGTGEFINTYYWCRVCAALHDEQSLSTPHWYTDINDWWRGPGVCTNGSWRSLKARKDVITDD